MTLTLKDIEYNDVQQKYKDQCALIPKPFTTIAELEKVETQLQDEITTSNQSLLSWSTNSLSGLVAQKISNVSLMHERDRLPKLLDDLRLEIWRNIGDKKLSRTSRLKAPAKTAPTTEATLERLEDMVKYKIHHNTLCHDWINKFFADLSHFLRELSGIPPGMVFATHSPQESLDRLVTAVQITIEHGVIYAETLDAPPDVPQVFPWPLIPIYVSL